jgi:micrococcal nuclease
MHPGSRRPIASTLLALAFALALAAPPAPAQAPATPAPSRNGARPDSARGGERRPQTRPHSKRVSVEPARIRVVDGDTVVLDWGENDRETVRILGIDTPETAHPRYDMPYAQSFGNEARAFARGAFAAASRVELLRADMTDPYGRTLGYCFVNGVNYSVLAIRSRYAEESVTRFGDNGFAREAAEVLAAARAAGPMPFEPPGDFRRRMRAVTEWMKAKGLDAGE